MRPTSWRVLNNTKSANFSRENPVSFYYLNLFSSGSVVSDFKTGKWTLGDFFPFNLQCHLLLSNLDSRQMKMNGGQALSFLRRYLKCRTRRSENGAHRSFTSTCWQRLWISFTPQLQGPFIFHISKWYVLFPDVGIIVSAGAANPALSGPPMKATWWNMQHPPTQVSKLPSLSSTRPLSPDCLELSCLPKSLPYIINVTLASLTFSPTWKLISHLSLFTVWRLLWSHSPSVRYWSISGVMTEGCCGFLFWKSVLFSSSHMYSSHFLMKCGFDFFFFFVTLLFLVGVGKSRQLKNNTIRICHLVLIGFKW